MAEASTIQVAGLAKSQLVALRQQAKARGLSAQSYARELIEDGLALDRRARRTTFDEMLARVQARFRRSGMTVSQLDALVDSARSRHHRRSTSKKKS